MAKMNQILAWILCRVFQVHTPKWTVWQEGGRHYANRHCVRCDKKLKGDWSDYYWGNAFDG
jgi:hypothetical protein